MSGDLKTVWNAPSTSAVDRQSVPQPQAFATITIPGARVDDSAPPLEIVLSNGICVRLREGFDPQMLTAVLAVLEKRAC